MAKQYHYVVYVEVADDGTPGAVGMDEYDGPGNVGAGFGQTVYSEEDGWEVPDIVHDTAAAAHLARILS
jgi:hypothetical protein